MLDPGMGEPDQGGDGPGAADQRDHQEEYVYACNSKARCHQYANSPPTASERPPKVLRRQGQRLSSRLNTIQLAISGLEGDVEDQLHHVRKLSDNLPPGRLPRRPSRRSTPRCQRPTLKRTTSPPTRTTSCSYELSPVQVVRVQEARLPREPDGGAQHDQPHAHPARGVRVRLPATLTATTPTASPNWSSARRSPRWASASSPRTRCTSTSSTRRAGATASPLSSSSASWWAVTGAQNTAEQVFQSFREVADGKPYVTEMDLRHSLVPDEVIEKLVEIMPPHGGPDMQADRGQPQFDYIWFMDRMIGDGAEGERARRVRPRGRQRLNGVH